MSTSATLIAFRRKRTIARALVHSKYGKGSGILGLKDRIRKSSY